MKLKSSFWDSVVIAVCLGTLVVQWGGLVYKYQIFGYYDWDLALFSQGMYQLSHGQSYVSIFDHNFLGNHANSIAYLLIPFFKIFPHPTFLLFIKTAAFSASAWILYIISKKMLESHREAFIVVLLYLLYPPNLFAQIFEFDFENLAPVCFFAMFYFFREGRWRSFFLTGLASLLIKENIPLVLGMFGLYGLFTKSSKWIWGVVPLVIGFGSCYALTQWIIPWFNSGHVNGAYIYVGNYKYLGNGMGDIVSNLCYRPGIFLPFFEDYHRWTWVIQIFGPFLFVPIFSPQILMLGIPLFAQHLLSNVVNEQSIYYHYSFTLSPFIFLAAIQILSILKKRNLRFYALIASLIVLFSVFNFVGNIADIKKNFLPIDFKTTSHLVPVKSRFMTMISPDEPVMASFNFLPALSQREYVYAFFKIYAKSYHTYRLPDRVKTVLVDFNEPWINWQFRDNFQISFSRLDSFFKDGWEVDQAIEEIVLFRKGTSSRKFLVRQSRESLGIPTKILNMSVDGLFLLKGMDIGEFQSADQVVPLIFYWQVNQQVSADYDIEILIQRKGQNILSRRHRIGYAIYPTMAWKQGDFIKEQYNLYVPGGLPEDVEMNLSFFQYPKSSDVIRN